MAKTNWEEVSDFERYPILSLDKGQSETVTFRDDGNFVAKKQMQDSGAKYPRDSHVFVVEVAGEKKEFWVGSKSFSVLRQLKRLKDANGDSLVGRKARIDRISTEPDETNYSIEGA